MDATSSPVILRTFSSDIEANIALGVLRANGIQCVLKNELMSSVLAIPSASYCTIKLLVNPSDIEVATKILDK